MIFEIVWDTKSLKILDKLPKEYAARIVKRIDEAKENPERYTETLVDFEGYKIRVGDYRVFVDLEYNPNKLIVRTIKHRREAYKKN